MKYIQARGRSALDLLIEGAVGGGPEPARHGIVGVCRDGCQWCVRSSGWLICSLWLCSFSYGVEIGAVCLAACLSR
jgi:hypothetical protein